MYALVPYASGATRVVAKRGAGRLSPWRAAASGDCAESITAHREETAQSVRIRKARSVPGVMGDLLWTRAYASRNTSAARAEAAVAPKFLPRRFAGDASPGARAGLDRPQ